MENYKEKYEAALKIIRNYYNRTKFGSTNDSQEEKTTLESAFPELKKESENEKIRKAIIDFFETQDDNTTYSFVSKKDIVAWLEKQGEHEINDEDTIQSYSFYSYKGEPNFKVGDWIVDNCGYTWKIKGILNQFYLLEDVEGGESCPTIEWVNKTFHLWTIKDAKDGDVLVDGNFVGILKENNYNPSDKSGCMRLYCSFDINNDKFYTESGGYSPTYFYPASKEQLNLLFKKMKEAGYEKINSYCQEHCKGYQETGKCFVDGECQAKKNAEHSWSEDDERMCNASIRACQYMVEHFENSTKDYEDAIDWLKSINNRVQPQPKQELESIDTQIEEELKEFAEEWDESLYRSDAVIAGAHWYKQRIKETERKIKL